MMRVCSNRWGGALVALSMCAAAGGTLAQGFPAKPVRYIVPSSAGGGADVLGRIVAAGLSDVLKQQVVVDNRAGASGNIAAELAAAAPADGYTLLQANIIFAANASLYKKLAYDFVRDFAPVTQLSALPAVLVIHPSLPVRSVKDLIALAKKQPGAINFSSAGAGSSAFLAAAGFMSAAGIDMLHVPYKGGGAAMAGLITGESSVMFPPLGSALPHVKAGKLRALGVTSKERFASAADLPTLDEAGLRGYEFSNWFGVVVPAKTSPQIVAALHGAVVATLKNASVSKRMNDLGYVPVGNRPEAFGAYIRSEIEMLRKAMQKLGIQPR